MEPTNLVRSVGVVIFGFTLDQWVYPKVTPNRKNRGHGGCQRKDLSSIKIHFHGEAVSLVPRGIHYNTLVTFLQHFCNGLLCVGNPEARVKYSKALQNCYKYVANMILVCLCTVGKSGVENVLCLCWKSVANGERNYLILSLLHWFCNGLATFLKWICSALRMLKTYIYIKVSINRPHILCVMSINQTHTCDINSIHYILIVMFLVSGYSPIGHVLFSYFHNITSIMTTLDVYNPHSSLTFL